MRDVCHKSMDVLQAYLRDAELFREYGGRGYFNPYRSLPRLSAQGRGNEL
jgi:hypothetical protein